jgi:hypothetical protein
MKPDFILTRESPVTVATHTITMAVEKRSIVSVAVFHSSAKENMLAVRTLMPLIYVSWNCQSLLLQDSDTPMMKATGDMETVPL